MFNWFRTVWWDWRTLVRRTVERVVTRHVEAVVAKHERDAVKLLQSRLDDAIRGVDFKPRAEAAAERVLQDALRRVNFCGVAFRQFLLAYAIRRLNEEMDAANMRDGALLGPPHP